jgi:hypothetical protein
VAGASVDTCHLGPVLSQMVSPSLVKLNRRLQRAERHSKIVVLCGTRIYDDHSMGAFRTLSLIILAGPAALLVCFLSQLNF